MGKRSGRPDSRAPWVSSGRRIAVPTVRRIIVGVHGSLGSLQALRYAAAEARQRDVPLVPVIAWVPPPALPRPAVPQVGDAVLPGAREVPGTRRPALGADGRDEPRAARLARP